MFTHTVVHYGEIALKGKNRPDFEKKLIGNIRAKIGKEIRVDRLYGRIVIESADISVLNNLKNVFGISHFSPCVIADLDIEDMRKKALLVAKSVKVKNPTFKVDATRGNKAFPLSSIAVSQNVGGFINDEMGWKPDLKNPDVAIRLEIAEKNAYVYTEKIPCLGGLPVGSTGKVVCLLSGGIDSPVAAWYAMKRGCNVVFVHFHTYTSKIEDKLELIMKELSKYQNNSRLYLIPFYETQEEIIKNVPGKFRMIIYKRFMLRIAEKILEKEHALGLVMGDNLAQVASQTLENMNTIYSVASYPIISPLIGFDKNEIIKISKTIGTYTASITPYQDCCSFMVVDPSTRAKKEAVEEYESKLDIDFLIKKAVEKVEIRDF
jgi:thiamine biosynthesis protein ThiI